MKKNYTIFLSAMILSACGGGDKDDSARLANEVCECYKKANGMDPLDTKRKEAQNACLKKQAESWDKVKDHKEQSEEFNRIIGECGKQLISQ